MSSRAQVDVADPHAGVDRALAALHRGDVALSGHAEGSTARGGAGGRPRPARTCAPPRGSRTPCLDHLVLVGERLGAQLARAPPRRGSRRRRRRRRRSCRPPRPSAQGRGPRRPRHDERALAAARQQHHGGPVVEQRARRLGRGPAGISQSTSSSLTFTTWLRRSTRRRRAAVGVLGPRSTPGGCSGRRRRARVPRQPRGDRLQRRGHRLERRARASRRGGSPPVPAAPRAPPRCQARRRRAAL